MPGCADVKILVCVRYSCKVVPGCADLEIQVSDAVINICVCADMDI